MINQLTLPSLPNVVFAAFFGLAVSVIALGIYRITLHPLAAFPGPKIAGFTYAYEFYHDVIRSGKYVFRVEELHKRYGPIVRVNPNELHIADPDFFSEIYHQKSYRTDRDSWYYFTFVGEGLAFTIDHDVHAQRRQALTNFFSQKSIRSLEGRITAVVSLMLDRLHQAVETAVVLDLRSLFAALTMDVASEYCFGSAGSTNLMSHPDMGKMWVDMGDNELFLNNLARHCKPLMNALVKIPEQWAARFAPVIAESIKWRSVLDAQIREAFQDVEDPAFSNKRLQEISIIHELIQSPDLTPEDKAFNRIRDEAMLLLGAGRETTATTLARTSFFILSNAEILRKLRSELREAIPDPNSLPPLDDLNSLPYLNAVIEEGLRMSMAVIGRMPRVFRDKSIVYHQWEIPPGHAISTTPYIIMTNPEIFPDPRLFNPDRWLNKPAMQKYQVAFSKGRRGCVGINLAYAELRLGLASVFRRFDLDLYETTRKDVDVAHDYFIGAQAHGTKGVRVKVVGELE